FSLTRDDFMKRRRICARFPWQKNARLRAKSQSAELALMVTADPSKYFRATALRRSAAMTVSSGNSDSAVVRRSCVHCLNWLIPKDLTVNGVNCILRRPQKDPSEPAGTAGQVHRPPRLADILRGQPAGQQARLQWH